MPSEFNRPFGRLSPCDGQVAYALLTRPPLATKILLSRAAARLACVRPAASVYPEPGSNSSLYKIVLLPTFFRGTMLLFLTPCACCQNFLKYRRKFSFAQPCFLIRNNNAKLHTFWYMLQIFLKLFSKKISIEWCLISYKGWFLILKSLNSSQKHQNRNCELLFSYQKHRKIATQTEFGWQF